MPVIRVVKPFLLNWQGRMIRYGVGDYDVEEGIADHWFVKAHLYGAETKPAPVTYAQRALEVEQAVRIGGEVGEGVQPPAPVPPSAEVAQSGAVPDGAFYFAGEPQQDKPMPEVSYAQPPNIRRTKGG